MLLVGGTKYSSRGTLERFPSSPPWQTIFDPDGSLVRKRHCKCGIEHKFANKFRSEAKQSDNFVHEYPTRYPTCTLVAADPGNEMIERDLEPLHKTERLNRKLAPSHDPCGSKSCPADRRREPRRLADLLTSQDFVVSPEQAVAEARDIPALSVPSRNDLIRGG
jgi:hypothetical protein